LFIPFHGAVVISVSIDLYCIYLVSVTSTLLYWWKSLIEGAGCWVCEWKSRRYHINHREIPDAVFDAL